MKYKKHLEQYEHRGYFFYNPQEKLKIKCNAPKDKGGVYLIYKIEESKEVLIYIGVSNMRIKDGEMKTRKGGLDDRLVNGNHQAFEAPKRRATSFPREMLKEGIEEIIIYWWVTHDENKVDFPKDVENKVLKMYEDEHGTKPEWHKQ